MRASRLTAVWFGYLFFVVYGSLVPLAYRPMPLAQAWQTFQQVGYLQLGLESRADWVANGVLYVPLGYLSATLLMPAARSVWRVPALLLAAMFCGAVAFGVEFTQLFFPPRTVSQNDLIAECIGSVLGVAAAPFLLPWFKRFTAHWSLGGQQLRHHLLQAYLVGYVLLCFFPYDFLLSRAELVGKLNSPSWGWLLAGGGDRLALAGLQLATEVALAVPIGLLAARRAGSGFWPGLLLGLAIEVVQFFINTAVSQGASVATRVLGVMLGVGLWRRREAFGVERWASWIRRYSLWIAPLYFATLSVANGWAVKSWHGLSGVAEQWSAVRLMPFYYHYYTSEARAVTSLGSIVLMYLPLGVLAWAYRWRMRTSLLLGGVVATLVEASKLFLAGSHPDPTNVMIAMVTCVLTLKGLQVAVHAGQANELVPAGAAPSTSSSSASAPPRTANGLARHAILMLAVAGICVEALLFPAFAPALCLLLLACSVAVWYRPAWALAIVPAALPVLDFAPWSGRFYWDEFDLLVVVCLLVGFVRTSATASRRRASWDGLGLGFVLLGVSFFLSTCVALWPLQAIGADSFITYTSPYNALRIVKGALWAWGFVLLYRRLAEAGDARMQLLSRGMQGGLALTLLFVLWERQAFVGLFDFSSDYRVTGPISAMHKGGAYIECYIAVASAFVLGGLLHARAWSGRLFGGALLLVATYAMMVTFSRNGYAALAVIVLLMLGARLLSSPLTWRRMATLAGVLVLVVAVAVPIVAGSYARGRLAASAGDLAVRADHWRDALEMRDPGWLTALVGVGVGRFPDQHFWRSKESRHAGTYSIEEEAGNRFLRLGTGSALYLEQLVDLEPGRDYVLNARVRSNRAESELSVGLCQKWMLTSAGCAFGALKTGPKADTWQQVEIPLKASELSDQPWYARRPLKLALISPTQNVMLDVDDVRLDAWPLPEVVRNGDFGAGLDHWFFTTDVDPPWHIHSLPVAILFDQGWLGVLAWGVVCALALSNGVKGIFRNSPRASVATAALLGFLVSGSLNTLIDAPRFLWLLLVLAWLCRGDGRSKSAVKREPRTR